jgi:hypothetical protein
MNVFRATGLAALLSLPQAALSQIEDPALLCDSAARSAAEEWAVPTQVMLALTRVETGRKENGILAPWPWVLGLGGEGHWFESEAEAIVFAEQEMSSGTVNMDLGCFQLNLRWHAQGFPDLATMLDPMENARYAAEFLSEKYQDKGNWVDAVAAYHSSTPVYAEAYLGKMEAVLTDLAPDQPQAWGEARDPAAITNNFPLLRAGLTSGFGSLVPAVEGVKPLFARTP